MSSPAQPDVAPVLIVGAGLSGLACARTLAEAGRPYLLCEAGDRPGGLARSEVVDGYTFDATGHWLHLRDPEIRQWVEDALGENRMEVERSAAIYFAGRLVPYPFQTNVWALPLEDRRACLLGLLRARDARRGAPPPRDFEAYVVATLGEGIAERFMLPYNRKLWGVPLHTLSLDWMGRFVPRPSDEEILLGCLGPLDEDGGYNARFLYPREGGIQALSDALAAQLPEPPRLGARVVRIETRARRAHLEDGGTIAYHSLVSTMALPNLVNLCDALPDRIRAAAGRLRSTHVTWVGLGVRPRRRRPAPSIHWVYFPGEDPPFYRAGIASAAVPSLAPPGCDAYYVEFSHHGPPPEAPETAAIEGLRGAGLIDPSDTIEVRLTRTIEHAYVLFDAHHADSRRAILDHLRTVSIDSIGRYGEWTYASMEDALLSGRAAARRLLEATP